MIRVRFSPDEIKSTKLLTPGKYGFILESAKEGITKEKKEKKYTLYFKGFTGEAKDVPVNRIYTEEYQEYLWAILEKGFGAQGDEEQGSDADLESFYGRKIWLVIGTGEYAGSKRNEITGFQPWEEGGIEETEAVSSAA